MEQPTQDELINRAWSAFYKNGSGLNGQMIQPNPPEIRKHEDRQYIVFENSYQTLAVYRIKTTPAKGTFLKGMKRWPKEVAAPIK